MCKNCARHYTDLIVGFRSIQGEKTFLPVAKGHVFVKALFLFCYCGIAAGKVRPHAAKWSREAEYIFDFCLTTVKSMIPS